MHEPHYRQVLNQAWQITVGHKILWIFGVLSLFLGGWGLDSFLGRLNLLATDGFDWPYKFVAFKELFLSWHLTSSYAWLFFLWFCLLALVVGALVLFLAVCSRGALVAAIGNWFAHKGEVPVARSWQRGVQHFWTVLELALVGKILEFFLFLLTAYIFMSTGATGGGLALRTVFAGLCLFLFVIIEAMMIFSTGYAVIEGDWFGRAITKSYRLLTKHFLVTLEMGLILMIINLAAVVVLALSAFVFLVPALLIWLPSVWAGSGVLFSLGFLFWVGLFMIFLVLWLGIVNTFNTAVWMYLFVKMHQTKIVGRLANWFKFFLQPK